MTEASDWEVQDNDWSDFNNEPFTSDQNDALPDMTSSTQPPDISPHNHDVIVTGKVSTVAPQSHDMEYLLSIQSLLQSKVESLEILRIEMKSKDEENCRLRAKLELLNNDQDLLDELETENKVLLDRVATLEQELSSVRHEKLVDKPEIFCHSVEALKDELNQVKLAIPHVSASPQEEAHHFLRLCEIFVDHCSQVATRSRDTEEQEVPFWLHLVSRFSHEVQSKISATLTSAASQLLEEDVEEKAECESKTDVITSLVPQSIEAVLCAVTEAVRDSSADDVAVWSHLQDEVQSCNGDNNVKSHLTALIVCLEAKFQKYNEDMVTLGILTKERHDALESMASLQAECTQISETLMCLQREKVALADTVRQLQEERQRLLVVVECKKSSNKVSPVIPIQPVVGVNEAHSPASIEPEDGTLFDMESFPSLASHLGDEQHFAGTSQLPHVYTKDMYLKDALVKDAMIERLNLLIQDLRATEARLREGLEYDYADLLQENEQLRVHTKHLESQIPLPRPTQSLAVQTDPMLNELVDECARLKTENDYMKAALEKLQVQSTVSAQEPSTSNSNQQQHIEINSTQKATSGGKKKRRGKGKGSTNLVPTQISGDSLECTPPSPLSPPVDIVDSLHHTLEKERNEAVFAHQEVLKESVRLKEESSDLHCQLESMREKLASGQVQVDNLMTERNIFADELAQLRAAALSYEATETTLRQQVAHLEGACTHAEKVAGQLQADLQEQSDLASAVSQRLVEKTNEYDALQTHFLQLKDEVKTIRESQVHLENVQQGSAELGELERVCVSVRETLLSGLDSAQRSQHGDVFIASDLPQLALTCKSQLVFYRQELEGEYTASDEMKSEMDLLRQQELLMSENLLGKEKECAVLRSEVEELTQQLAQIQLSLAEREQALRQVLAQKEELLLERAHVHSHMRQLEDEASEEVHQMKEEISILSNEPDLFPQSSGWDVEDVQVEDVVNVPDYQGELQRRIEGLLQEKLILEHRVEEQEVSARRIDDMTHRMSTLQEDLLVKEKSIDELSSSLKVSEVREGKLHEQIAHLEAKLGEQVAHIANLEAKEARSIGGQDHNNPVNVKEQVTQTTTCTSQSTAISKADPEPKKSESEDCKDGDKARVTKLMKRVKILQNQLQGVQQELQQGKTRLLEALEKAVPVTFQRGVREVPDVLLEGDVVDRVVHYLSLDCDLHAATVVNSSDVSITHDTLSGVTESFESVAMLTDVLNGLPEVPSLLEHLQSTLDSMEDGWSDSPSQLGQFLGAFASWLTHYQRKIDAQLATVAKQVEEHAYLKGKFTEAELQISQLLEENDALLDRIETANSHARKCDTKEFCGGTGPLTELQEVKNVKKDLKRVVHTHKALENVFEEMSRLVSSWYPLQQPSTAHGHEATLEALKKVKYIVETEKQQLKFDLDNMKEEMALKEERFNFEIQRLHDMRQVSESTFQQQLQLQKSHLEQRHTDELAHWQQVAQQNQTQREYIEQQHAEELARMQEVADEQQARIARLETALAETRQARNHLQQQWDSHLRQISQRVHVGCDPLSSGVRVANKAVNSLPFNDILVASPDFVQLSNSLRECHQNMDVLLQEKAQILALHNADVEVLQQIADLMGKYWSIDLETWTSLPNFLDSGLSTLVAEKEDLTTEVNTLQKETEDSFNTIRELEAALQAQEELIKDKEDALNSRESEFNHLQRMADERNILLNELYERDPHHVIRESPVSVILLKEEVSQLEDDKWNLCTELSFYKDRTLSLERQLDQWKRSDSLMLKLTEFEQVLDDKTKQHNKVVSTHDAHSANNHYQSKDFKMLEQQLLYLKKQLEEQIVYRFQLSEATKELAEKDEQLHAAKTRIQDLETLLARKKGLTHDAGTLTEAPYAPRVNHVHVSCTLGLDELARWKEKATLFEKQCASLKSVEGFLEDERQQHKLARSELERVMTVLQRHCRSTGIVGDLASWLEHELEKMSQQAVQMKSLHAEAMLHLQQDVESLQRLLDEAVVERDSLTVTAEKARLEADHLSRLYEQLREDVEAKEKLITQLQYIRKDLEEDLMLAKRQSSGSTSSTSHQRKSHQSVQVSMENAAVLKYELNCLREESQFSATHVREELQRAYLTIMDLEKRVKLYENQLPGVASHHSSVFEDTASSSTTSFHEDIAGCAIGVETVALESAIPDDPDDSSSLVETAAAVVCSLFQEESIEILPSIQQIEAPPPPPQLPVRVSTSTSTSELDSLPIHSSVAPSAAGIDAKYSKALKRVKKLEENLTTLLKEKDLLQSENGSLKSEIESLEDRLTQMTFAYEETQMAWENSQHQQQQKEVENVQLASSSSLNEDLLATRVKLLECQQVLERWSQVRVRLCEIFNIPVEVHEEVQLVCLVEQCVSEWRAKLDSLVLEKANLEASYQDTFQSLMSAHEELSNVNATISHLTQAKEEVARAFDFLKETVLSLLGPRSPPDDNVNGLCAALEEVKLAHAAMSQEAQWCHNALSVWLDLEHNTGCPLQLRELVQRVLQIITETKAQQQTELALSQKDRLIAHKRLSVVKRLLQLFTYDESTSQMHDIESELATLALDLEEAFERDITQEERRGVFKWLSRVYEWSRLEERARNAEWFEQEVKVLEESHAALQSTMNELKRKNTDLEGERNHLLQQMDAHIKQLQAKQLEIVALQQQEQYPRQEVVQRSAPTMSPSETDLCSLSMTSCGSLGEGPDSPLHAAAMEQHISVVRDLYERITQSNATLSSAMRSTTNGIGSSDLAVLLPVLKEANQFLEEAEVERKTLVRKYNKCLTSLRRHKVRVSALSREVAELRSGAAQNMSAETIQSQEKLKSIIGLPDEELKPTPIAQQDEFQQTDELETESECERLTVEIQMLRTENECLQAALASAATLPGQSHKLDVFVQTDVDRQLEHFQTQSAVLEEQVEDLQRRLEEDEDSRRVALDELRKNFETQKEHIRTEEEEKRNVLRKELNELREKSLSLIETERATRLQLEAAQGTCENQQMLLSEAETQLNTLRSVVEEWRMKATSLEGLQSDISNLVGEKTKLSQLLHSTQNELTELKDQCRVLVDEVGRLNQEKTEVEMNYVELNSQFTEECNRTLELERQLQQVEEYFDVATQEVDRLRQLQEQQQGANVESLDEMRQEMSRLYETNQILLQEKEKLLEHKDTETTTCPQCHALQEENETLVQQLEELNSHFQEECNRSLELERQLQQVEEYFDVATQEVDNLRAHEAALMEELEIAKEAFERLEQERAALQGMMSGKQEGGETSALSQQVHWLQIQLENTQNERVRIQQEFNRLSKAKSEVESQLERLSATRDAQGMSSSAYSAMTQSLEGVPATSLTEQRAVAEEDSDERLHEFRNQNENLRVQVNILQTKCKKMEFKIRSLKKKHDNLVLKLEDKDRELDESVDHIRKKLAIQERERTKWLREVAHLKQQLQEKTERIRCLEKHARGALTSDELAHTYLSEVVQLREEVERLTSEKETARVAKEEEWKAIQGTVEELKSDNRQLQSKLRAATAAATATAASLSSSSPSKSPSPGEVDENCIQCQQLAQMVQLLEEELQHLQGGKLVTSGAEEVIDGNRGLNDWGEDWDFTSAELES